MLHGDQVEAKVESLKDRLKNVTIQAMGMLHLRYQWLSSQTIGTRLSNAKAHKLINKMAENHAELNDETLNDTAGDWQSEVPVVTMAEHYRKV